MTPPDDLQADGRSLWEAVHAWLTEEEQPIRPHELPMLAELCRTVDRLAHLRSEYQYAHTIAAWSKISAEERQQRLTYGRIISAIGLPTGPLPDSDRSRLSLSARSRRGTKAAAKRWNHDKPATRDSQLREYRKLYEDDDKPTDLAEFRAL